MTPHHYRCEFVKAIDKDVRKPEAARGLLFIGVVFPMALIARSNTSEGVVLTSSLQLQCQRL